MAGRHPGGIDDADGTSAIFRDQRVARCAFIN
jgi:hypothetical protein